MAKAKQKKPTYYKVDDKTWNSGVKEGVSITVQRIMHYDGERADFKPFLAVPMKELEKRLKASKAEEKKVYDQLQKDAQAWDEHGAQTLLLQKAIEYLKVPEVKHTSNEWVKRKDGSWEISNLVYKMTFSITRSGMEWKLVWEVSYMAPALQVGYRGYERTPRERIDYEGSKKYKTLDGAQNYVQLKFDQYSGYFKELSPPIPPGAKELFCVNGQLLQGYTVSRPRAKEKEVTLSDLLDCIDEKDLAPPKAAQPVEERTPSQPIQKKGPVPITAAGKVITKRPGKPKHTAKKKPPHKKKSPPTR